MSVATYIGTVRHGHIDLIEPVNLPEGSQVYVVVPTAVDERAARHKANGWLIDNVGNMVMADQPTLAHANNRLVWRFGAFVTSLSHQPLGPIGYLDVDATTGEALGDTRLAAEMIVRGESTV